MESVSSVDPYMLEVSQDGLLSEAKRSSAERTLLTTLPQFVNLLARSGLNGPHHLHAFSLDKRGVYLNKGAQFEIFKDRTRLIDKIAMKRVKREPFDVSATSSMREDQRKQHMRALELEIMALSETSLRNHPNIISAYFWGFDYPARDLGSRLPVLFMEQADYPLDHLLVQELPFATRYQLLSDVLAGLSCLHAADIVHGDLKPANILIFKLSDSSVPFLAKLNDFGMCISLEDEARLSYRSYGGTLGWRAPELLDPGRNESIDLFDKRLLLKCDVFSFGLLALSLITNSKEPVIPALGAIGRDPYAEVGLGIVHGLAIGLASSTRMVLNTLISATLRSKPSDRSNLHQISLKDDTPEYFAWYETLKSFLTCCISRSLLRSLSRLSVHQNMSLARPADGSAKDRGVYPDRSTYWRQMDANVLGDLEKLLTPKFHPKAQQILTGETLFGMAMSTVFQLQIGFQERFTTYMYYAACAGSVQAQGIIGRLLEAREIISIEEQDVRVEWLRNAVASGSLVAAEDLKRLDAGLFRFARGTFLDKGGFNIEANEAYHSWENQPSELSGMTISSARPICDSMDTPDHPRYRRRNTLLHFAAMYGNCAMIRYLVEERSASINIQNSVGETPLYKACLSAHSEAVRTLIDLGADAAVLARSSGISCLHWLFNFETPVMKETAELLVHRAGGNVNAEIVPSRVKGELLPIPYEHFPFHWPFGTPLHWAVAARSKNAVETLLALGCNVDAVDLQSEPNGQTALTMAMYRADPEMAELLVAKGAGADELDSRGRNIVHMLAADHTHMNRAFRLPRSVWSWVTHGPSQSHLSELDKCLTIAHKSGLNIDSVRRKCQTPLLDAVETSDACSVMVFLEKGANVNVLNSRGRLALHEWLAIDGRGLAYPELYLPVLERLVSLTEDLNQGDAYYGESSIHYASTTRGDQRQFEKGLSMLLAKDPPADINAPDRYGQTPFSKLLGSNDGEVVPLRSTSFIRLLAKVDFKENEVNGLLCTVCGNRSLTDGMTLSILKCILDDIPWSKRHYLPDTTPNPLVPAIQWAKIECARLFIDLGTEINEADAELGMTPLDLAIHEADFFRETFVGRFNDTISSEEQTDALEDGTAFTTNFLSFGTGFGYGENPATKERYLNAPKMIDLLESLGARRARDLIDNPGRVHNPFLTDYEMHDGSKGIWDKRQIIEQPFLSQWMRIYEIAWDEHKDARHPNCHCCKIFKTLPPHLTQQAFTIEVFDQYLEVRPSVEEVENLLSEC